MVLPFAHIKIEVYNNQLSGGQSKYNNKHRMKSNSGMIFVMIGDRRSGGQSTKQQAQPHTTHVTTFIGWFWHCRCIPSNIVRRMSLERRITQTA